MNKFCTKKNILSNGFNDTTTVLVLNKSQKLICYWIKKKHIKKNFPVFLWLSYFSDQWPWDYFLFSLINSLLPWYVTFELPSIPLEPLLTSLINGHESISYPPQINSLFPWSMVMGQSDIHLNKLLTSLTCGLQTISYSL